MIIYKVKDDFNVFGEKINNFAVYLKEITYVGINKPTYVLEDTIHYEFTYFLNKLKQGDIRLFMMLFQDHNILINDKLFKEVYSNRKEFISIKLLNNYLKIISNFRTSLLTYTAKKQLTPLDFSIVIDTETNKIELFHQWAIDVCNDLFNQSSTIFEENLSLISLNHNTFILVDKKSNNNKSLLNKDRNRLLFTNKSLNDKLNPIKPMGILTYHEDKYKQYLKKIKINKLIDTPKYVKANDLITYNKRELLLIYVNFIVFIKIVVNQLDTINYNFNDNINKKEVVENILIGDIEILDILKKFEMIDKKIHTHQPFSKLRSVPNELIQNIIFKTYQQYAKSNKKEYNKSHTFMEIY